MQYISHGMMVEISQQVGISSTASLDIAAEVDVQASPWGGAILFFHAVI